VLLRGATVRGAVRFAEELRATLAEPFECAVYGHPPFEYGLRPGWGVGSDAIDGFVALAESVRPSPSTGPATRESS
jgi:hypothetical protein